MYNLLLIDDDNKKWKFTHAFKAADMYDPFTSNFKYEEVLDAINNKKLKNHHIMTLKRVRKMMDRHNHSQHNRSQLYRLIINGNLYDINSKKLLAIMNNIMKSCKSGNVSAINWNYVAYYCLFKRNWTQECFDSICEYNINTVTSFITSSLPGIEEFVMYSNSLGDNGSHRYVQRRLNSCDLDIRGIVDLIIEYDKNIHIIDIKYSKFNLKYALQVMLYYLCCDIRPDHTYHLSIWDIKTMTIVNIQLPDREKLLSFVKSMNKNKIKNVNTKKIKIPKYSCYNS